MITTLIAALTMVSPGSCCPGSVADARLSGLIEAAWQEQSKEDQKAAKAKQAHEKDLKSDAEIGAKYAAEADKQLKASTNQEVIDRVNRIGQSLAEIANKTAVKVSWGDKRLNTYKYTFKVVEKPEVNAFSLPGGFIYVFDGLVKYVESDDELAGVLAHEIAHASLRHLATLERERSKLDLLTLPMILVSIVAGASGDGNTGAGVMTLTQLITQANSSGWGLKAEESADYAGFQYMQKSGYDPVGALTFMEKLARDQRAIEAIDWGIYRTHPPSRERASNLERLLKDANLPIQRSKVATSFRALTVSKESGEVDIQFNGRNLLTLGGQDAKQRAEALVPKLNGFFDQVPDLFDVSMGPDGEIYWRREVLLQVQPKDAEIQKASVELATAGVLKSIKRELYLLAYRIWETR